jgi:hypothetical protein
VKVYFTPEAQEQAEECDVWWRENRPTSRDLFARELAEMKGLLLASPNIGLVYAVLDGQPVGRVRLKKTRTHVYYVVDTDEDAITIHAVWGAPKGRGPLLKP